MLINLSCKLTHLGQFVGRIDDTDMSICQHINIKKAVGNNYNNL